MNDIEYNHQYKDKKDINKIRVAVRKRPLNKKEYQKNDIDIIEMKDSQTLIVKELKNKFDLTKYIEEHHFSFDSVFDESSTNDIIYNTLVRPMVEAAFETKTKVTSVSKPNVMAEGRFWDKIVKEIHDNNYPNVNLENVIVDNMAFQLMINPSQYNGVVLMENMQGDILTDQAGGILGSLGLMPTACVNPETKKGYFEPAHGSAPSIAGQNIANPYSMIGSVALMLDKAFGLKQESADIWGALTSVFGEGFLTKELAAGNLEAKVLSTSQFGDQVAERILSAREYK